MITQIIKKKIKKSISNGVKSETNQQTADNADTTTCASCTLCCLKPAGSDSSSRFKGFKKLVNF